MENYNNEDAFVNLVNKNRMIEENVKIIQDAVYRDDRAFSNHVRCTNERKRYIEERRKYLDRKNVIKRWIIAGSIVGTLLTGFTAAAVYGDDIAAYSQKQEEASVGTSILRNEAMMELLRNNLAIRDVDSYKVFKVLDNTVMDYKVLDVSGVENVYIYRSLLPKDEFQKFIKSVSFLDEEGRHYYSDFDHFLEVNGYTSEKDFEKAAIEMLSEMYSNGKIKDTYGSYKGAK